MPRPHQFHHVMHHQYHHTIGKLPQRSTINRTTHLPVGQTQQCPRPQPASGSGQVPSAGRPTPRAAPRQCPSCRTARRPPCTLVRDADTVRHPRRVEVRLGGGTYQRCRSELVRSTTIKPAKLPKSGYLTMVMSAGKVEREYSR